MLSKNFHKVRVHKPLFDLSFIREIDNSRWMDRSVIRQYRSTETWYSYKGVTSPVYLIRVSTSNITTWSVISGSKVMCARKKLYTALCYYFMQPEVYTQAVVPKKFRRVILERYQCVDGIIFA